MFHLFEALPVVTLQFNEKFHAVPNVCTRASVQAPQATKHPVHKHYYPRTSQLVCPGANPHQHTHRKIHSFFLHKHSIPTQIEPISLARLGLRVDYKSEAPWAAVKRANRPSLTTAVGC